MEELSVSTCWELLRSVPIGRIALPAADDIEVFPVNFLVDGGTIVFRTGAGTKLSLIGDGERCTFEADEIAVGNQLVWSVVLKGPARPVSGHDEVLGILDLELPTWHGGSKPMYVRMRPEITTGRRFFVEAV